MIRFGSDISTASLKDRLLNGLFTPTMITQKYHLILGAFLLLTISCDCRPRPVENGQDDWEAILETAGVKILGTINANPVIEVHGTIRENNSKETILGVLLIPDGDSVDDVAEELANNKDPKSPDTEITLATDRHAYYDKTIAVGHTGRASVTAFSDKSALQADRNYNAHLMLGEQHVSYSTVAETFTVPTKTTSEIDINVANAKIQSTGIDKCIVLDLKSTFNFTADRSAGFIFIEQGSTEASATKLIVAIIKQHETLPIASVFQKFYDREDIIIYPHELVAVDEDEIDIKDVSDTAGLFKRGATYQVYCYVVGASNNYTISQGDKYMAIPRPIVELKMEEANIRELIHAPVIGTSTLKLELRGSIAKREGTENPQAGFLLTTEKPDRATAAQKIEKLIKTTNSPPYTNSEPPYTDIIRVADGIRDDITEEVSHSLEEILGRDYNVYYWLCDGIGAIFVSDNSAQLKIPKADLSIKNVTSTKGTVSAFDFTIETQVKNGKNLNNPNTRFLFLERGSGQVITQEILRLVLLDEQNVDDPPHHILSKKIDYTSTGEESYSGSDNNYLQFRENSQYDIYYCLRTDSAIFCVSDLGTAATTLNTYKKNEPSEPSMTIKVAGVKYYVYDKGRVECEDTDYTKRLLKKSSDQDTLKKVLGEVFQKNSAPDNKQIEEFLKKMPE